MQNISFAIPPFALRRTACCLALAALCALPVAAHAAEPAWWTAQKKACGLNSSLAYNSWDGVCRKSPGAGGGVSAQDQLLLEGAGALGTAIGESIHESLFGSPEEEARKAAEAAEQRRLIELQLQEDLRRQELAKQRILGELKSAETFSDLGLKTDATPPLAVTESPGAFGGTAVVPAPSFDGLQLKLGDNAEPGRPK